MKTDIISASYLMQFQKQLRLKKGVLIRAIPFTNEANEECYHMMYVGEW